MDVRVKRHNREMISSFARLVFYQASNQRELGDNEVLHNLDSNTILASRKPVFYSRRTLFMHNLKCLLNL